MNKEEYGILGGIFAKLAKQVQRGIIAGIWSDEDLDYRETNLTLWYFVRKSNLGRLEKLRLLRRYPHCLKLKCVSYCRENNIVVKCDRKLFRRRYYLEGLHVEDNETDYTFCLFSRRGTLKYLYSLQKCR